MFRILRAHGNFYPDFVAELDDGRILVGIRKSGHAG